MTTEHVQTPLTTPVMDRRPKLEGGRPLVLHTEFSPAGDQPTAIKELVGGVLDGEQNQVLLGATGTGKTDLLLAEQTYDRSTLDCNGKILKSCQIFT